MMRLIDADDLKGDAITVNLGTEDYPCVKRIVYESDIDAATSIEAVPVVRCKDCKHRGDPEECIMCFTAVEPVKGGQMYRFHDLTTDNGYCNRGTKMDLEG